MNEEERKREVWTEADKVTTSSNVEKEYERGRTPRVDSDLHTFKGEIHINEGLEAEVKIYLVINNPEDIPGQREMNKS